MQQKSKVYDNFDVKSLIYLKFSFTSIQVFFGSLNATVAILWGCLTTSVGLVANPLSIASQVNPGSVHKKNEHYMF